MLLKLNRSHLTNSLPMKIQKQFSKALKLAGKRQYEFAAPLNASVQYVRMVVLNMDGEAKKPLTQTAKTQRIETAVLHLIEQYRHLIHEPVNA